MFFESPMRSVEIRSFESRHPMTISMGFLSRQYYLANVFGVDNGQYLTIFRSLSAVSNGLIFSVFYPV